jgi:anti-sigma factor RsiW
MRSILEQLPDDDSVLLMYLADELPAGDREIVENRLAADPALRAQLEKLRETHELIAQEMSARDQMHPPTVRDQSSLRQVTRQIRQWQTDRAREAAASGPVQHGRPSWWLYPAAAAVIAIITYTVWWGFQPAEPGSLPNRNATVPGQPFAVGTGGLGPPYNPTDTQALYDAEQELDQVQMLRTLNESDEQDTVI